MKKYVKGEFRMLKKNMRNYYQQTDKVLVDIEEIKTLIAESQTLKENENIITFHKFCELHDLQMPLSNLEEFEAFEVLLNTKICIRTL